MIIIDVCTEHYHTSLADQTFLCCWLFTKHSYNEFGYNEHRLRRGNFYEFNDSLKPDSVYLDNKNAFR